MAHMGECVNQLATLQILYTSVSSGPLSWWWVDDRMNYGRKTNTEAHADALAKSCILHVSGCQFGHAIHVIIGLR